MTRLPACAHASARTSRAASCQISSQKTGKRRQQGMCDYLVNYPQKSHTWVARRDFGETPTVWLVTSNDRQRGFSHSINCIAEQEICKVHFRVYTRVRSLVSTIQHTSRQKNKESYRSPFSTRDTTMLSAYFIIVSIVRTANGQVVHGPETRIS